MDFQSNIGMANGVLEADERAALRWNWDEIGASGA
jgi:hypothetical protein